MALREATRKMLGLKIRYVREERLYLSKTTLAAQAGIHRDTLSWVEEGTRKVQDATLDKIISALGTTRRELADLVVPESFRPAA